MKRIVFFTHARLGDLHVSRGFVKKIAKRSGLPCYYYGLAPKLLADCGIQPKLPGDVDEKHLHSSQAHFVKDGTLWVNTWYAAGEGRYVRDGQAALFDTLYRLFDDVVKTHFGHPISRWGDPSSFLPDIDFSFCQIKAAKAFMATSPARVKVLVANGRATAGQAPLFPMLPPLVELGRKYPGVLFIYTNTEHEPDVSLPPNVHFSRSITRIGMPTTDLNECGYLSTHCQLIVGRFSGAYTFSLIRKNLQGRAARYLTFSDVPYPAWLGPTMRDCVPLSCSVTQCRGVGHKVFIAETEKALRGI